MTSEHKKEKWEDENIVPRTDNDIYAVYDNWVLDPVYLKEFGKHVFVKKEYPTDGRKPYVEACACQGCQLEIGRSAEIPNFSQHCECCSCEECVCPKRVEIGAFNPESLIPHWDNPCGFPRCYNCEKDTKKQRAKDEINYPHLYRQLNRKQKRK